MTMIPWPDDRLTRFEVARIVGARALQIALGAPVLVSSESKLVSPIDFAKLEFKNSIIPITIKRTLPSGEQKIVSIRGAIRNWMSDHSGEI
jgi:DNA-directed RNA polymerase subunit K